MDSQIKVIDLANHILAIKDEQCEVLNQYQLTNLTLKTINWLVPNHVSYQLFQDYNSIQYQNRHHVLTSIYAEYKYYAAMPILDEPPKNKQLSQISGLTKFIQSESIDD